MEDFKLASMSTVKITNGDTGEVIFQSDNFPTENITISGGCNTETISISRIKEIIGMK